MAKNKIITSQGNVQFINSKGKTISMHPMHCYAVYQDDTVSFLFIYMKEYSGQAFFSSQFEDLEVDGETYDSIDALKEAIAEAFAKAGAQARTEIVDELPETGYTNTIYLVKKEHGEGYDEYVYNDEKGWQLLGDTDIEFERYLQKVDFNAYSADTKEKIDFISGAVDDNASDIQFISGAVDTEISDREAADAVISGAVDTLSTNLSNEVQRAQNAEQTLQNNINTVNSRIDAEQLARANADNALSGAIDSVDDKIEALSGDVQTMGDEAIVDAEYVSSSTTIDFYNASGDVVAQVDATDFIKDGMIDDVRIETISGVTYLVIDFNTASGKEDIKIPLTDIFNPDNYYDKTAVDGFVSDLEATDSVISGAVDNVSSDLATESQRAQNAEGVLSGAIDTKLAISDFNTYSASVETALSGKANASDVYTKSEVYTKAEVDEAIAEIDLSDYYTKTETDGKLADKADLSALTEDERVWGEALNDLNSRINTVSGDADTKLAISDFNTYSASVETELSSKASQSAVDALNGVVTAHTANTDVHVTSAEKATWNGKQDTLIAGENITISGNVISSSGGGGSITIDPTLDSGSTNAVANSAITTAIYAKADVSAVAAVADSLRGYVTTSGAKQEITGDKTFIGSQKIHLTQSINSDKPGFKVFAINNTESGASEAATFEYRPNTFTIDSVQHPLLYLGQYRTTAMANHGIPQTVVGFRQYDQPNSAAYHMLAPLPDKAKTPFSLTTTYQDFYIPMGFKNGSTMIKADETGVADLSSELGGLKLMKITQSAYDALVQGGTVDANTLYIISD